MGKFGLCGDIKFNLSVKKLSLSKFLIHTSIVIYPLRSDLPTVRNYHQICGANNNFSKKLKDKEKISQMTIEKLLSQNFVMY